MQLRVTMPLSGRYVISMVDVALGFLIFDPPVAQRILSIGNL